jgi:hypothetical protein
MRFTDSCSALRLAIRTQSDLKSGKQHRLGSLSHRELRYQRGMQEKCWRINSE